MAKANIMTDVFFMVEPPPVHFSNPTHPIS
jgi:hypothetical protein